MEHSIRRMIKTIGIDFQKMWKREDKVQACMNKEDEGKGTRIFLL